MGFYIRKKLPQEPGSSVLPGKSGQTGIKNKFGKIKVVKPSHSPGIKSK